MDLCFLHQFPLWEYLKHFEKVIRFLLPCHFSAGRCGGRTAWCLTQPLFVTLKFQEQTKGEFAFLNECVNLF